MTATRATRHVPQRHTRFDARGFAPWHDERTQRLLLHPQRDAPDWTAFVRARAAVGAVAGGAAELAFFQVLVVAGALKARDVRVGRGAFLAGIFSDDELLSFVDADDTLLIVHRRAQLPSTDKLRFVVRDAHEWLWNPHADGNADRYASAFLIGNPLKALGHTALVRFPRGTVVSSHHHPAPIFHELIYLDGGHMTPDGFYGPGDHVLSFPGGKEGPWLAAPSPPSPSAYPSNWPRYVDDSALFASAPAAPFASPLALDGDTLASLIVHHGPFVVGEHNEINWTKLAPGELGSHG